MVSDVVLGALVGVGGTVLGAGIQSLSAYLKEKKRLQEERRRWYADYWMDKNAEMLTELAITEHQCFRTIRELGNRTPENVDELDGEVMPPLEDFIETLDFARIYLSEDEITSLERAVSVYKRFLNQLRRRIERPPNDLPWSDFENAHDEAYSTLRNIVHPLEERQIS